MVSFIEKTFNENMCIQIKKINMLTCICIFSVFGKSLNSESTQTTDALMKLLDSFFLTLTCNGQIVLVSSSIEQHLGHCQVIYINE